MFFFSIRLAFNFLRPFEYDGIATMKKKTHTQLNKTETNSKWRWRGYKTQPVSKTNRVNY